MGSLYIIIPAYNEEANIGKVLDEWYPVVEAHPGAGRSRLVVVNDGSRDSTGRILEEYAALGPWRGEEKSPGQSPKRQEDHGEKESEWPKDTANPPWELLERIAAELLDTAAGLKMGEEKNREKLEI